MCGILASVETVDVGASLKALAHRGPDAEGVMYHEGVTLVHKRLAIIDVDHRSDQPFRYGKVWVSFNGEIWNFESVRRDLMKQGCAFRTNGDTEVVAAVLDSFGWEGLRLLDGMFAVAWTEGDGVLRAARDRFGEIPLHWCFSGVASEVKAMLAAGMGQPAGYVPPGGLVSLKAGHPARVSVWHANGQPEVSTAGLAEAAPVVRAALCRGVTDRTLSDVPVCSLLSGGLDSSAIAWAAKQAMPSLVCYSAVTDPSSQDAKAARLVADHIGCELREVRIPAPTLDDLRAVVAAIEMPHKAQVEIAWPCRVLADRIAADGFKVVFSGEGSDELWGSYGFSYHGIKAHGFGPYRRQTFLDQHRKNFARCNKIFMTRGIECRLPFLHPPLVDFAWSLPESSVRAGSRPKAVLEEAFRWTLPTRVVDRAKVAFQIGLKLDAAAAKAGGSRQAYEVTYASQYSTDDSWRGAGEDRFAVAPDYRTVRPEARGSQRSLFA